MSEEKVLTLRGKKAVWAPGGGSGPIDPKRLPEGYPYKEGSKTEIVWDGNTDGLVSVGGLYYKVSDAILDNETIKNGYLYGYFGGNGISELALASFWDRMHITDEFVVAGEYAIFVRANNAEIDEMTFPEAGVYFVCVNGLYGTKFVSETETIHPMAPEFLPAGGGGGVQVVTMTVSGETMTASHTGEQIAEMAMKGPVILTWDNYGTTVISNLTSVFPGVGAMFLGGNVMGDRYSLDTNFVAWSSTDVTYLNLLQSQ